MSISLDVRALEFRKRRGESDGAILGVSQSGNGGMQNPGKFEYDGETGYYGPGLV